jgi:transcriptional regulator with XRE-family HTH domain
MTRMSDSQLAALARAICKVREEADLSQASLAQKADLTPTSIGEVESGEHEPTYGTMRRLARGLGISLPELVKRIEEAEDG